MRRLFAVLAALLAGAALVATVWLGVHAIQPGSGWLDLIGTEALALLTYLLALTAGRGFGLRWGGGRRG